MTSNRLLCPHCDGFAAVASRLSDAPCRCALGQCECSVSDEPCPLCGGTGRRTCDACGQRPGHRVVLGDTVVCAECDEPEAIAPPEPVVERCEGEPARPATLDLATFEIETIASYGGGPALKLAPLEVAMPARPFTLAWDSAS